VQDLGGLGSKEGPLEAYTWVPSSMLPQFLPWLSILFLLAIKSNRVACAWWVWAGLGGGLVTQGLLRSGLSTLPSQPLDALAQTVNCLSFGLAAVWLLAGYLAWKHRFLTFLGIAGVLSGFSGLTFFFGQVMGGEEPEFLATAMILGLCAFVIPVSLSLAGLCCRGQYRPGRLAVWLAVWVMGICLLAIAPFFVFAIIGNPGSVMLKEFAVAALLMAGVNFGAVLPFLLLSLLNPFHQERLKGLLHLGRLESPPPAITATPADLVAAPHAAG